ncbi:MAG: nitroreductase family protein [Dehalococcoidia bacterium]
MDITALEQLMATQRAVRRFRDEPVEDATIERVLAAATRAPSARNIQPWRFVVVRNPETKGRLGDIFDELGQQMYGPNAPDHDHWRDVPVLVVVCAEMVFGRDVGGEAALAASVYPAVQNLLLAAHAIGLGTVLTTRWKRREAELRPLLGLPENVSVLAIVPMGWPDRAYGKNRRAPVAGFMSRERFGEPWR